jgi:hypothetical protein
MKELMALQKEAEEDERALEEQWKDGPLVLRWEMVIDSVHRWMVVVWVLVRSLEVACDGGRALGTSSEHCCQLWERDSWSVQWMDRRMVSVLELGSWYGWM